jgi:hypothetical protein
MLKNCPHSKTFGTFLRLESSPCAFGVAANQQLLTTLIPDLISRTCFPAVENLRVSNYVKEKHPINE